MFLKTCIATLAGQTSKKIIKAFRKGSGEAAPGLITLKIDPNYIKNRQKNIKSRIIISGTNGKTTTNNLIAEILKNNQQTYITNPRGSNLSRGVAASLLSFKKNTDFSLWEADEAALIDIAQQTSPTHILLTNLFRDQLDRYGEIDTTLKKWIKLLQKLPKSTLILNADDPSLAFLGQQCKKHHIIYFGIKDLDKKYCQSKLDCCADAIFCPHCHKQLIYNKIYFSHLGNYECNCGFTKPKLDFSISHISFSSQSSTFFINRQKIYLGLEGLYNIYNAAAAFSLTSTFNFDSKKVTNTISEFKPVFGRQEIFEVNNKKLQIFLIKNPTGANQVLSTLKLVKQRQPVLIVINDNIADGRDVSWLWDVDFNKLKCFASHIIVSGQRAFDMGLRLKYDDFQNFEVEPDLEKAMTKFKNQIIKWGYILPTYTAMGKTRKILKALCHSGKG
jgi:lipid II isoglutaminyl synthase (glutamine-hydrolysing)